MNTVIGTSTITIERTQTRYYLWALIAVAAFIITIYLFKPGKNRNTDDETST